MRLLILEGHLIVAVCNNVVLTCFEEAHDRAKRIVYTPVFDVMGQAAVKAFFTMGADELPDDLMYKLAESQNFIQVLVHHLRKLSRFAVPVARLVKKPDENAVASEARF